MKRPGRGKAGEGDTKARLLGSAGEVFARKGYRDATIAEISKLAGANIAAVNYHFGTKEALYVEAWRAAFQRSLAAHPPDGGVPATAPAAERLHGRVRAMMERILDPDSHEFEIIHKEMANPTGLLAKGMREVIEPMREGLAVIIRELLGEDVPADLVALCQMSVRAQCFDLLVRRGHATLPKAARAVPPLAAKMSADILAAHVTRFSLAGIRDAARRQKGGKMIPGV